MYTKNSSIVQIYAGAILDGRKTLDEVPTKIKSLVEEVVNEALHYSN